MEASPLLLSGGGITRLEVTEPVRIADPSKTTLGVAGEFSRRALSRSGLTRRARRLGSGASVQVLAEGWGKTCHRRCR